MYASGQTPTVDGVLQVVGKLGDEVTIEEGQRAARLAALNCLAEVRSLLGTLDAVLACRAAHGVRRLGARVRRAARGDERCLGADGAGLRRGRPSRAICDRRRGAAVRRPGRGRADRRGPGRVVSGGRRLDLTAERAERLDARFKGLSPSMFGMTLAELAAAGRSLFDGTFLPPVMVLRARRSGTTSRRWPATRERRASSTRHTARRPSPRASSRCSWRRARGG